MTNLILSTKSYKTFLETENVNKMTSNSCKYNK